MGLFDWLFGKNNGNSKQNLFRFDFVISDSDEDVVTNKWFQKESWNNKRFVKYQGVWDSNWKWAEEGKVKVAGISRDNRTEIFLYLSQQKDFTMFLEDDPQNPVNKNARKIMVSGTLNGEHQIHHIGYLPDEISTKYAGVELDIRPSSIYFPEDPDNNIGVKIALLERTVQYLNNLQKR